MKRKHNEQPLKEVIEQILRSGPLQEKLNEIKIVESWAEVAGRPIANRTTEVKLKGKVLIVKLNSAVLRDEIFMQREELLQRINQHLGENLINEIVLL